MQLLEKSGVNCRRKNRSSRPLLRVQLGAIPTRLRVRVSSEGVISITQREGKTGEKVAARGRPSGRRLRMLPDGQRQDLSY